MSLPTVTMVDAAGNPQTFAVFPIPGSGYSAMHVMADALGNVGGGTLTPVDRGGQITTMNVAQPAMTANTARRGGWIQADPGNQGTIYVRLVAGSSTYQSALAPGAPCPLSIDGGVIRGEIDVMGTFAGDKWLGLEL